jgi:dTDP-glucose 4,6-dehydratase
MRLLVTGGAGFIGSEFVRRMLREHPDYRVTVLDALTYCGNLENFPQQVWENPNFTFWHGDVRDEDVVRNLIRNSDRVIHFAAETHVDRSIDNSDPFISTDVKGTQVLMESIRRHPVERFIHISTSEVYGSAETIPIDEHHPLNPQSPYAAAKVGADRLAYSYYITYGLPIVIVRPFNNYGHHQFPEKLIPLFVTNAIEDKPLPIYGHGRNTRDWLFVDDCCEALDLILTVDLEGVKGEVINLGTGKDFDVLTIAQSILEALEKPTSLMQHVTDRPGHVARLVSSTEKVKQIVGWEPKTEFKQGLTATIRWYQEHEDWWRKIKEGRKEYQEFYQKWYGER